MPVTAPWIYVAGPLFTEAEIQFNQAIAAELLSAGYSVYLPQAECAGTSDPKELFNRCMMGLDGAALVVVILDGTDADSGSCFEMGYAYARELPIVGIRTDFRGSGEHMGLNLMLTNSCDRLLLTAVNPPDTHPDTVTYRRVGEAIAPPLLKLLQTLPASAKTRHS